MRISDCSAAGGGSQLQGETRPFVAAVHSSAALGRDGDSPETPAARNQPKYMDQKVFTYTTPVAVWIFTTDIESGLPTFDSRNVTGASLGPAPNSSVAEVVRSDF